MSIKIQELQKLSQTNQDVKIKKSKSKKKNKKKERKEKQEKDTYYQKNNSKLLMNQINVNIAIEWNIKKL